MENNEFRLISTVNTPPKSPYLYLSKIKSQSYDASEYLFGWYAKCAKWDLQETWEVFSPVHTGFPLGLSCLAYPRDFMNIWILIEDTYHANWDRYRSRDSCMSIKLTAAFSDPRRRSSVAVVPVKHTHLEICIYIYLAIVYRL